MNIIHIGGITLRQASFLSFFGQEEIPAQNRQQKEDGIDSPGPGYHFLELLIFISFLIIPGQK
jgi:hypothetical protein